jgi:hypothetical protein
VLAYIRKIGPDFVRVRKCKLEIELPLLRGRMSVEQTFKVPHTCIDASDEHDVLLHTRV